MANNNIKFDDPKVDTELAKAYLNMHGYIHSKGYDDNGKVTSRTYDTACKTTYYYADYTRLSGTVVLDNNIGDIPKKLYDLAKKLEENVDLFCQLEFLIRKIPIGDTKNIDMELLIQNCLYYSRVTSEQVYFRQVVMDDDTPLVNLGCVVLALMSGLPRVSIECGVATAATSLLFTQLCHQVGLQKVTLAILPEMIEDSIYKVNACFRRIEGLQNGCVGILTSNSDIDSAVDTFVTATVKSPWKIKKILVQEGAVERFKNALDWKTNLSKAKQATGRIVTEFEASSTTVYQYEDKLFLYEFSGHESDVEEFTVIDVYRTTKELISLLKDAPPFCVSLWSSDVAESNEIAFNIDSNIVWVNDYCNFRGPPKSSQVFFSSIKAFYTTSLVESCSEIEEVIALQESWLKLDMNKREDLVRDILRSAPKQSEKCILPGNVSRTFYKDIDNIHFDKDSFACVGKNSVCMGIEMSPGIMKADGVVDAATIRFIVKGGGVVFYINIYHERNEFSKYVLDALREKGAPIVAMKRFLRFGTICIFDKPFYRRKVVWSSYGTIFAN